MTVYIVLCQEQQQLILGAYEQHSRNRTLPLEYPAPLDRSWFVGPTIRVEPRATVT
jgi:hypothetical protein